MTAYFNGRQDALARLEAAVVNLQVNVLEGMISAHRAATVSPKELERARDRARDAIASGEPQEEPEEKSSRVEKDPAHPIDGAGSRGPGGNRGSRPPALSLEDV